MPICQGCEIDQRPYGAPLCPECTRKFEHHQVDIGYEAAAPKVTGPGACAGCEGTGVEALRREYNPRSPAEPGTAHMVTTRKCPACDGQGVAPVASQSAT